jgi:hypothetical protein
MIKIKIKEHPETKEAYLDIMDFKDIVDVSKIVYYELDGTGDTLKLTFFDKDQQVVPVKE